MKAGATSYWFPVTGYSTLLLTCEHPINHCDCVQDLRVSRLRSGMKYPKEPIVPAPVGLERERFLCEGSPQATTILMRMSIGALGLMDPEQKHQIRRQFRECSPKSQKKRRQVCIWRTPTLKRGQSRISRAQTSKNHDSYTRTATSMQRDSPNPETQSRPVSNDSVAFGESRCPTVTTVSRVVNPDFQNRRWSRRLGGSAMSNIRIGSLLREAARSEAIQPPKTQDTTGVQRLQDATQASKGVRDLRTISTRKHQEMCTGPRRERGHSTPSTKPSACNLRSFKAPRTRHSVKAFMRGSYATSARPASRARHDVGTAVEQT